MSLSIAVASATAAFVVVTCSTTIAIVLYEIMINQVLFLLTRHVIHGREV